MRIFDVGILSIIEVETTKCGVANMTDESKTKTVRNAMLGVVVLVMPGCVGCGRAPSGARHAGAGLTASGRGRDSLGLEHGPWTPGHPLG